MAPSFITKSKSKIKSLFSQSKVTMATPVVLILGAGPRIGASVAENFASQGYKVAVASRKGEGKINEKGYLSIKADFTDPQSIAPVFEAVKAEFGTAPSVVIYNAATLTPPPVQDSALSIPSERVAGDLVVNTVSPYVAAQQALAAWETLPKETKKTFIYTGNAMGTTIIPVPLMLNLGIGKSASLFWVGVADLTYAARGVR
jgi:NAD(P)-dependent dehydrogenase (short-subunit alcohol dehydrogenase family)